MGYSVVVNRCFGGFGVSQEGIEYLRKHGVEFEDEYSLDYDVPRHHPILIQMVRELGSERASGRYAKLEVIDLGDCPQYLIDEYDGFEDVQTPDIEWIDARVIDEGE